MAKKRKAVRKKTQKSNPVRQLLPLPNTQDIAELADWIEVSAWSQSDKKISRSEVASVFVFGEDQSEAESKIDDIWREIEYRVFFLKDKYPFCLSSDSEIFSLKLEEQNVSAYIFCLLLSFYGLPKLLSKKTTGGSYLFEKLCTHVAGKYVSDSFGSVTKSIQFGSPRKEWPSNKKPLVKAISELIDQIGSGTNKADGVRDLKNPGENNGDGGLDVVAWRCFPDDKTGFIVLFGQCATAKDHKGCVEKVGDLERFLKEYVDFDFSHILGLFVPHVLSCGDEYNWKKIERHKNIPFDRIRIGFYGYDWSNGEVDILLKKTREKIKINGDL
jgi:hypothetical protein